MKLKNNSTLVNFKTLFSKRGLKETAHKILHLNLESWKIALSIGLGIFIGISVPMGLHTLVAIPLALLFECNLVLTATATLVANPVTIVPLYYVSFKIGSFLTGLNIQENQFYTILNSPTLDNLKQLGSNTLLLFFSGAVTQGIILGLITYFISLFTINYYRRQKKFGTEAIK